MTRNVAEIQMQGKLPEDGQEVSDADGESRSELDLLNESGPRPSAAETAAEHKAFDAHSETIDYGLND